MSKLHLIQEIETAVKMATDQNLDEVKLTRYLDDLLTNYQVEARDDWDHQDQSEKYLSMYISSLRISNYAQNTLEGYNYELRRFYQFIEKPLIKVQTFDVRSYLDSSSHLKSTTLATKLNIISSFYSWLVREDELLKNPCDKINPIKTPTKLREGLTIVELEKMRNACANKRQRALIEVFYSTGCRLDEIRKINLNDIDWHTGFIKVSGKGDKERRVFLSQKAMFYLDMYLETRTDECPALFVSERKPYRRLTREGIRYLVKQVHESTDIDRSVFPHLLRHSFAQLSLDAGMEVSDLQAIMGHTNSSTTARYAQASDERKYMAFKQHHIQ